jgi:hypothetical protein
VAAQSSNACLMIWRHRFQLRSVVVRATHHFDALVDPRATALLGSERREAVIGERGSMPTRIVAAVAAVVVTGGIAAASAAADPGGVPAAPGAQCPAAFDLVSVDAVLDIAAPGFERAIRAEDRNKDNQLCVLLLPGAIPLFEPTFLFYDNRVPTRT